MVAQLDDDSIEIVVEDGVLGRGLTGCEIKQRIISYDHSRQVRKRDATQLLEWDFVLKRDDGTVVRLHPEWSSVKVSVYHIDGYDEPLRPPQRGLGRSDGGKGVPKIFSRRRDIDRNVRTLQKLRQGEDSEV